VPFARPFVFFGARRKPGTPRWRRHSRRHHEGHCGTGGRPEGVGWSALTPPPKPPPPPPCIACTPTQRAKPRGPSMCFSDRLPRNLALRSYRHRPVGSGEMRNFLSEHSGAFDPDEVHTLVATMLHSIRHGRPFKPAEWSTRRLRPKCGRYSQNILLPPQCTVSVTTPDGAPLALAQSNRTRPIRCAKPLEPKSPRVSGMGLDFAETVRPRTAPPGSLHF
jgi:hypothetical protein